MTMPEMEEVEKHKTFYSLGSKLTPCHFCLVRMVMAYHVAAYKAKEQGTKLHLFSGRQSHMAEGVDKGKWKVLEPIV